MSTLPNSQDAAQVANLHRSFEGPVALLQGNRALLYREGIRSMKAILARLALTIGTAVSAAAEPLVSPDVLMTSVFKRYAGQPPRAWRECRGIQIGRTSISPVAEA